MACHGAHSGVPGALSALIVQLGSVCTVPRLTDQRILHIKNFSIFVMMLDMKYLEYSQIVSKEYTT